MYRKATHLVLGLLVGTEHVTDLSATSSDITSGDISVVTNVSGQLSHECVTLESALYIEQGKVAHESPDLVVRLALGVKVGSSLTTTHHQTSQGVLEDLLETEATISTVRIAINSQLQDGKVDSGV